MIGPAAFEKHSLLRKGTICSGTYTEREMVFMILVSFIWWDSVPKVVINGQFNFN